MIPGYNDSTVPTNYDPFEVQYDNGYQNGSSDTTFTTDFWQGSTQTSSANISNPWVTIYIEAPPRTEREESEALKAFKKAVASAALLEDQRALRTLRDDPSPRIPLQARKGLSGRQAVRKRVCAGSSRYRVLVN